MLQQNDDPYPGIALLLARKTQGKKVELPVQVIPSRFGKAVIATRAIMAGELILQFRGRLYDIDTYKKKVKSHKNYFLQVDRSLFLGPTRSPDNYVNHSCEPNGGLIKLKRNLYLKALRPIEQGEEVTFDYSTSMSEDFWEMDCCCGAPTCRGRIRDFRHLPVELQQKYLQLNAVPSFILENLLNSQNVILSSDDPSIH